MEICNMDGSSLFLQKHLEAGLLTGKGVSVNNSHFCYQGMEFGNAKDSQLLPCSGHNEGQSRRKRYVHGKIFNDL